ncbi:hypothetical protein CRG98_046112 [Punica granatum]|uniref:Uncharacterized protein n=1 Tax=Punica granatum TaxID=22663 RepID=A0A2I0HQK5_PUNGR|nr:hypothetical protein CRG98_046112 [Punica granatum]
MAIPIRKSPFSPSFATATVAPSPSVLHRHHLCYLPSPTVASIIPSWLDLKEARSRWDGSATNPGLESTRRHEVRSLTPRRDC